MTRNIALLLAGLLFLSGCSFQSGEALLYPPKAPLEYRHLQEQMEKLLASGSSYAPPVSGFNRQSIQTADLNGDGQDEALVFMRDPDDRPLKIRIYSKDGDDYIPIGLIEGAGEAIDSVAYGDLDSDNIKEIITGWRVGGALKALTVHTIVGGAVTEILSAPYDGYALNDINNDGITDLMVARYDAAQLIGYVDLYARMETSLERVSRGALSYEVESLSRMITGTLIDNSPALFVASQYKTSSIVTDVFVYRDETLMNVSVNMGTQVSDETIRNNVGNTVIYAADINQDGFLDLPSPFELPLYGKTSGNTDEKTPVPIIIWNNYTSSGELLEASRTYHNMSQGWYLLLPQRWGSRLTIDRRDSSGSRDTVFAMLDENGNPHDELIIYSISKAVGEKVDLQGKILLYEKVDMVIAAELFTAGGTVSETGGTAQTGSPSEETADMTAEELVECFKLIRTEWLTGS